MKRPIAELLWMALKPGVETERRQHDHEEWQILRRKQGYVTHRVYAEVSEPLRRLVYSEWESKKAADGARQYLHGTPLMRRARSTLATGPQRLVVEIVGPITSTKGLDLPDAAAAATAMARLAEDDGSWHDREAKLWRLLSSQPGHITHIRFHGFEDPLLVGSLSHWLDASALENALAQARTLAANEIRQDFSYLYYAPVRD
jgi:heme-degrading monooxygenase HmoA